MTHDDLYKKYKYYGFSEDVTTLQLIKPIYDRPTNMIKNKIQLFNHCKFEEFYLIRCHSEFLNELKIHKDMVYMLPIVDIRLSKSEYKLLEKFLLKHLSLENVMKIEHYHKRGFLRRI